MAWEIVKDVYDVELGNDGTGDGEGGNRCENPEGVATVAQGKPFA